MRHDSAGSDLPVLCQCLNTITAVQRDRDRRLNKIPLISLTLNSIYNLHHKLPFLPANILLDIFHHPRQPPTHTTQNIYSTLSLATPSVKGKEKRHPRTPDGTTSTSNPVFSLSGIAVIHCSSFWYWRREYQCALICSFIFKHAHSDHSECIVQCLRVFRNVGRHVYGQGQKAIVLCGRERRESRRCLRIDAEIRFQSSRSLSITSFFPQRWMLPSMFPASTSPGQRDVGQFVIQCFPCLLVFAMNGSNDRVDFSC